MLKWLSLFFGVSIGVAIFLAYQWYAYVTNRVSPYDQLGIELNGLVPQGWRDWGCGRLRISFPEALPPAGCAAPGGGWRQSE